MQQDVRRSDTPEPARAEPEPKVSGFARGLFQFGSKRNKRVPAAGPGLLQNRLKEVLERDRALIASQPPPEELVDTDEAVHIEDDAEVWPDPYGHDDPKAHTGTRAAMREPHPPREPELLASPRGLELGGEREPADLTFSQIASWIEEEIGELPEPSSGPVTLDAPLDEDEAAELDAVLAAPAVLDASAAVEPAPLAPSEAAPPAVEPAGSEPTTGTTKRPVAKVRPAAARPVPEPDADAPTHEPIRTLTMARLLAMQGYKSRALVVYRELIERAPGDRVLRAEYEKLSAS
jgi:hypothetical protein